MFNFLHLFRLDLGFAFGFKGASKKEIAKKVALIVLICACFAVPLFFVFSILYFGARLGAFFGGLAEILNIVFFAMQLMMFMLFLPSYVSVVFFSKDTELLSSLPIGKTAVFSSRMLTMYLQMLAVSFPITLIAGIVAACGASSGGYGIGVEFWFILIFAAITVPIIPLSLITLISFPVMKFVSLFKANSTLKSVLILLLYGVIMAVLYYGVISFQNYVGKIDLSADMTANDAVHALMQTISKVGGSVYPSIFITKAMVGESSGVNFIIYSAIIVGLIALILLLSMFFYSIRESGALSKSSDKIASRAASASTGKSMSVRLALIRKEFLCVIRESQLALQTFAPLVILPVIIVVYSLAFGRGNLVQQGLTGDISFFVIAMVSGVNVMSTIAISREGDKFSLIKTLPVSSKDVILSKLWLADILSVLVVSISVICAAACKSLDWIEALLAWACGIMLSLGVNCLSLSRDIKNPNFRFTNYKELVKKSSKSLVPMLLGLSVGAINMLIKILTQLVIKGLSDTGAFWLRWGITIALSVIILISCRVNRIKKMCADFEKIEG
ncbi:MAG: hypothetical protein K2M44_01640 [Clostridia bacterium]|nr:hypothetical protein [Clostridia bacterium]